mgnify:CR=1 FL=1|jgi:hypothetical protein
MDIYELEDFFSKTAGGRANRANMTIYFGKPYDCACGQTHDFNTDTNVLRELSGMRFVMECPEDDFVTCVKISGLFNIKLKSLFGGKNN